ncbi:MAG: hypothetical protein C4545_00470 [Anaerolineaceae bacterium]|jgi:hypothetical protein|nr:MAG: hypothetical protein C4545_00470 [Anaerolineaceae bacterium]
MLPKRHGNLGFLVHNHLAGTYFKDLTIGNEIIVLLEHGGHIRYCITNVLEYRALQPRNSRSTFINLQTNVQRSAGDVFRQVYMGMDI